jgi:MYXO-CTERM domain-containing protein
VCARAPDDTGAETQAALSWYTRDLTYALHADGTANIDGSDEFAILDAAFQVWAEITDCSADSQATDITFTRDADLVDRDLVGYDFFNPDDNENLLIFRDSGWLHASSVIALTTTTYGTSSGEIIDADIEFNSESFTFGDLPDCCPDCNHNPGDNPDSECRYMDLSNTAVHEIGHVLGLGHPDDWTDIDPTCSSAATMCATAALGTVDKRSLACDDRNAIVFKYPAGEANQYCEQPSCAEGQTECGDCTTSECASWRACGFCGPPTELTQAVQIVTTGSDDGIDNGCQCATSGGGLGAVLAALLLRRTRRRRQA